MLVEGYCGEGVCLQREPMDAVGIPEENIIN